MVVVNTNITALLTHHYDRLNREEFNTHYGRLATGLRINTGADDPSGLAISQNMTSQIRGIRTAMENIQDTVQLLRAADSAIDTVTSAVMRIRDLAVRLANRATLNANPTGGTALPANQSDTRDIKNEIGVLREGIKQLAALVDYNQKGGYTQSGGLQGLLLGTFAAGQSSQVGPDNGSDFRVTVTLPDLNNILPSISSFNNPAEPPPNATDDQWLAYAGTLLDDIDEKITTVPTKMGLPTLNNARVEIGILDRRLTQVLDDLQAEYINLSAARSRISDADAADEMLDMTKTIIKQQSAQAVATQANAVPMITLQLLGAVYSGMQGGAFSEAT